MAGAAGYISATLSRFGITLSAVEMDVLLVDYQLQADTEYTAETAIPIKRAIVGIIPQILATPDVTEDGFARKYDRAAVAKFCSWLAGTIGEPDPFAEGPTDQIMDMSNIW